MKLWTAERATGCGRTKRQQDVRHLHKDARVGPVQVSLVVVKGRPDPLAGLLDAREVPRRGLGEDLRERLLVLVGEATVREDVEPLLIPRHAPAGSFRSPVLAGAVVEDEVEAEAHAPIPQKGAELAEVLHRPERPPSFSIIRDGVAAVIETGRSARQERHDVNVVGTELFQVVQPSGGVCEGAHEPVGVKDVAYSPLALKPVRGEVALQVQRLEVLWSVGVPGGEEPYEARREAGEVFAGAVGRFQAVEEILPVPFQPQQKGLDVARRDPMSASCAEARSAPSKAEHASGLIYNAFWTFASSGVVNAGLAAGKCDKQSSLFYLSYGRGSGVLYPVDRRWFLV
jgi:hypothetical protein